MNEASPPKYPQPCDGTTYQPTHSSEPQVLMEIMGRPVNRYAQMPRRIGSGMARTENNGRSQMSESMWKECSAELPQDGDHVLVYLSCRAAHPENSSNQVLVHSAIYRKGRTAAEVGDSPAKHADQDGNNFKPYVWDKPHGGHWYGQDVKHWMPLPKSPAEDAIGSA